MGCPVLSWIFLFIGVALVCALYLYLKQRNAEKKLERWSKTPKDVVILHAFPAGKTLPSPSPFILKVETFMRMANISYQIDTEDYFGPKQKSPWVSINGQHISDSEIIIEFLTKKFEKNLNKNFTEEQLAVAHVTRVMLDEHFIWGLELERFVFSGFKHIEKIMSLPFLSLLKHLIKRKIKRNSIVQGTGRHSKTEVVHMMTKNLRAVSKILGNKKFICGDEPCEYDCGIFSHLAQCVWALPESTYEKLVNGELNNLKDYCIRMKEKYWTDWDTYLSK